VRLSRPSEHPTSAASRIVPSARNTRPSSGGCIGWAFSDYDFVDFGGNPAYGHLGSVLGDHVVHDVFDQAVSLLLYPRDMPAK
jgi:hypothetical protein